MEAQIYELEASEIHMRFKWVKIFMHDTSWSETQTYFNRPVEFEWKPFYKDEMLKWDLLKVHSLMDAKKTYFSISNIYKSSMWYEFEKKTHKWSMKWWNIIIERV